MPWSTERTCTTSSGSRAETGEEATLMSGERATEDLATFESHRPVLLALAYRMLGDVGRAQDMVQEAWLRWHRRDVEVDSPRAFLVTVVTRLCLNELDSARARREESRGDRLPEPVALEEGGMARVEELEQLSMAILVVLERLTPAERAALLLHDAFDFSHEEIAALVSRSPAACRKLLERARRKVSEGRRLITASRGEQERLLETFLRAAVTGDVAALVDVLATDAALITDGGPEGRTFRGFRNLRQPLEGAERVAAFVAATSRGGGLDIERRELNGQPGLVLYRDDLPFAAILLAVADGKIQRIFFHADPTRLGHLGPRTRH
jgi:RNA polymerase sigma-70 factor, ECF subfamily